MEHQIDPPWGTHSTISSSSQCFTIGVTKAMGYAKHGELDHEVAVVGFLSKSSFYIANN